MKKVFLLLLLAVFLIGSYWGYTSATDGSGAQSGPAPDAGASSWTDPAPDFGPLPDSATAPVSPVLTALLDRLRDGLQPGTAGGSLRAASAAADLLDWSTDPDPRDSAEATVREWLAAQSEDALAVLPEQLDSLASALTQLTEDYEGSAGLLEDAGLSGRGPWTAQAAKTAADLVTLLRQG